MKTETPFLILSAELAALNETANARRSEKLAHILTVEKFDFMPVVGRYLGTRERSYLVLLPTGDGGTDYGRLLELAQNYGQESVLYVDAAATCSSSAHGVSLTALNCPKVTPLCRMAPCTRCGHE